MKKTFFINGGAGRIICSISALEEYHKTNEDFIVIADGNGQELFKGSSFQDKVFFSNHKNLFEDFIIKCDELVTPEPYHLKEYITQKCSINAGFNSEINDSLEELSPKIYLSIAEQLEAQNIVKEVKAKSGKDKVIFVQPFGRGAELHGENILDLGSRSFMESDAYYIPEVLAQNYAVIVMSEFELKYRNEAIAQPKIPSLRLWGALIGASDYFIGCDSLGQHFAKALNVPATVVLGATFPTNVSYPNDVSFNIVDLGKNKRVYQPIRISSTEYQDMKNDGLMFIGEAKCKELIKDIKNIVGVSKEVVPKETKECKGDCSNG